MYKFQNSFTNRHSAHLFEMGTRLPQSEANYNLMFNISHKWGDGT